MNPVSNAILLAPLDKIDASFRTAEALARQAVLAGLPEALPTPASGDDLSFILALGAAANSTYAAGNPDQVNNGIYRNFFSAMNAYIAGLKISGVATLDQYASNQNVIPFTLLIAPNAAYLYWLSATNAAKTGAGMMQAGNVFAPVTQFGTATLGAAGAATFGAGASIRTANDTVNGFQGYAPAKGLSATATTAVNGTEVLSVTYNGATSAGVAFTGHVGTLDVSNLAAGATTAAGAWTPAAAGERIAAVTALAASGSPTATAGAITVQSILERVTS